MAHDSSIPGMERGSELLDLLRPYVRHCGDSRRPAWEIEERRLLDYLLVHIAAGTGRFRIAGEEFEVRPNDLFWIPPDTLHRMEGYAPGMRCSYVHFDLCYRPGYSHWDFSIPGGLTDLSGLQPLLHPPLAHPLLAGLKGRILGHTNRRVGGLIREVCGEAARAQPYAGLRMSGLMMEILAEIFRGREGLPPDLLAHIPFLEAAADDLNRNCRRPPAFADLARRCRLSESHFRALFGRHFGCSPRTYARQARLRQACELMVSTALTIGEIADRVGFETVHGFSKAFRQVEGIPPSAYRRCAEARVRVEGRQVRYKR